MRAQSCRLIGNYDLGKEDMETFIEDIILLILISYCENKNKTRFTYLNYIVKYPDTVKQNLFGILRATRPNYNDKQMQNDVGI